MRGQLQELNQSLWMSELASVCDLVVPMDVPSFGEKTHFNKARYADGNYFQKSALYSLAFDNIANHMYKGRFEMRDMLQQVIYSEQPNLCTLQMQAPYPFRNDD